MKVIIIGAGYVGVSTAAALAYLEHKVYCIDENPEVIKTLQGGGVPFYEPGLSTLLSDNLPLTFGGWETIPGKYDVIIIAVGTPPGLNGEPDLSHVVKVAENIGDLISSIHQVIILKSTVPPGTTRQVQAIIENRLRARGFTSFPPVTFAPEFLREGAALYDTLYPDRIVVGAVEETTFHILYELYKPILEQSFQSPPHIPAAYPRLNPSFFPTNPLNAEMIKYAANAYLATKISFINEFAALSENLGTDILAIAQAIGLDKRIGPSYLQAGVGWGGSCFGKDLQSILYTAGQYNCQMKLLEATVEVNQKQRLSIIQKLQAQLKNLRGMVICLWGISFKPDTDDIRDSPFLYIAKSLLAMGAVIRAHDPAAIPTCKKRNPDLSVHYYDSPLEAITGCDALLILTDWKVYKDMDFKFLGQLMRRRIIIDGRNILADKDLKTLDYTYVGVGR